VADADRFAGERVAAPQRLAGRLVVALAPPGSVGEGLARDCLFIDGAWRDHVLNARLKPRFDAAVFAAAVRPVL
jgi:hypothetical protein